MIYITASASSKHERQVIVAESISDVETSIDLGVEAVVSVVAGPEFVSDNDDALSSVFLHGPGTLQRVFADGVKEFVVKDALVSVDEVSLLLGQDSAEVDIAIKLKGGRPAEALEALISADLMKRGHLESANRDDLALSLNGVH